MEIIICILLILGLIEGAYICYQQKERNDLIKAEGVTGKLLKELDELERVKHGDSNNNATRRDIYGTFQNPLGDSYRKNTNHQYVPIKPYSKMLDGDDEDGI